MKDLAAYFSSLYLSEGSSRNFVDEVGKMLFKAVDAERGIPSCAACHRTRANGSSLAKYPKISFQHPENNKS
ncbi:cytochrome c4, partial [Pseudoalteromonas agarivorans]|uniref:c-type cytochrome n=1 Tax=Pseudoalteromonas agarivorans TaxID=176102 RepID=UPI003129753D